MLEQMLTQLLPLPLIIAQCATRWGISEQAVRSYVQAIFSSWAADPLQQHDRAARKVQMRNAMGEFYNRAVKAGAFGPAAIVLDRMAKLDGLYEDEARNLVAAQSESLLESRPDLARQRLRELVAKHGKKILREPRETAPAKDEPEDLLAQMGQDPVAVTPGLHSQGAQELAQSVSAAPLAQTPPKPDDAS